VIAVLSEVAMIRLIVEEPVGSHSTKFQEPNLFETFNEGSDVFRHKALTLNHRMR
jgi:hypothetical protein